MPPGKRLVRNGLALPIDRARGVPSYRQLAEQLRRRISAGQFPQGSRFPAEREIMSASGLSRVTVRQGLGLLQREGWLERKQGLGTFVRNPIDQDLTNVRTITEVLLEQGITPQIKVLSFGAVVAPQAVRQALGLREGERLLRVKRLYRYRRLPIALVYIYLPLCVQKDAEILRKAAVPTDTTYTIWEDRLGVRLKAGRHVIRAAAASTEDARALGVKSGAPILVLERITYADDGRPLEYILFHYHAERYEFSALLPRARDGVRKEHGWNGTFVHAVDISQRPAGLRS